jgi:hypothetical protein
MTTIAELWGTFAVDDHLRKRAYVAETILFDRVVVPKPPDGDRERWKKWVNEGWRPEQLQRVIGELGELAIAVPWTQQHEDRWRKAVDAAGGAESLMRLGQAAASDVARLMGAPQDRPSSQVTRQVLADSINEADDRALYRQIKDSSIDPTTAVEAVVGYGSLTKFQRELPLEIDEKQQQAKDDGGLLFG